MQPDMSSANESKDKSPLKVQWEVSEHKKYENGNLLQVSYLYVIKVYDTKQMLPFNPEPIRSVLLRVTPSMYCVLLNKAAKVEVLSGITLHKFTSKKKSHAARMQDLSKYFKESLDIRLPESIKKSFIKEFEEASRLLKGSISI